MLIALSIRDFVLIDALDVSVHSGFTSVTGETGAGKSILLEALRFVLGSKAEKRLIRSGAEKTIVSASFQLEKSHPVFSELEDRGLQCDEEGLLTFRRVLSESGPSRMFVNDQIVSADFASQLGAELVEIHGQFDNSSLLNAALHGDMLDQFAKAGPLLARVNQCFDSWQDTKTQLEEKLALAASREAEIIQAQNMLEDLDNLSPQSGEAARLGIERAMLMNSQKLMECLDQADNAVRESGAESVFGHVARQLDRALRLPELSEAPEDSPQLTALRSAQEAVERVLIELGEAGFAVESAKSAFDHDPGALEEVETRLFALRAAGRKFGVDPDGLADLHLEVRDQLQSLGNFEHDVDMLTGEVEKLKTTYLEAAKKLSSLRQAHGRQLSEEVMRELAPLKLERAVFRVSVEEKPIEKAGRDGMDKIAFEVQTNPGAPFGALNRIASGGELARFTLALRVCLAEEQSACLLIFDEADQGVGGAVAAAVGERLSRLAEDRQVLAITHSPQVAAAGRSHWHVSKHVDGKGESTASRLKILDAEARQEELARMLSGSEVTKEARAAAERLMSAAI